MADILSELDFDDDTDSDDEEDGKWRDIPSVRFGWGEGCVTKGEPTCLL